MTEKTIYELSQPGRKGFVFPDSDVPAAPLPKAFERGSINLPELSELDVIRHFTNLSRLNYSVDGGFYPLGSCTMKYNPKINEVAVRLPGFSQTHPLQPITSVQGNLYLMYQLQEMLQEISGFHRVTLTPAAGAQGELVGALIIKKFHESNKDTKRVKILIPDSAHGTNPATSAMSGFEVAPLPSDARGNVDLEALKLHCDETLAGLMLTTPNTLGLFDENVIEVIEMVHNAGGLVYGDGANLNALLGIVRPGDLGFDIMHFNLHKTFATPHGGGGPGSGPVGVSERLAKFLPGPIATIVDEGDDDTPPFYGFYTPEESIGRMKAFYGHFGVVVKAFTYIAMHGPDGLRDIGEKAVLNANYLMEKVKEDYYLPYDRTCMHEFVVEGTWKDIPNVHALDISKRLMDYGFHPPTNYFPLVVHEALMIEPTETESKQTLDAFAAAMKAIAKEAREDPGMLNKAPYTTPIRRSDEVKAARDLVLCCWTPDSF
ncbi:MAG: aminomethyl-transferring glycine dehydrogenase subunit GcvPB [Chloroflexi bacterium]|nr:aminomethyl-transferring glycine dehydrogenase subunit GcvPB [Chloroflexota bacterium]